MVANDPFAASLLFAPELAEDAQYATVVATRHGHEMRFIYCVILLSYIRFAHITVHITQLIPIMNYDCPSAREVCLLSDKVGSKQR